MRMTTEKHPEFVIGQTTRGDTTVLAPTGSITFENCAELRIALEQATVTPQPTVIIDAQRISAIDSEALDLLATWHQTLHERGGALKLVALTDTCADILTATRLVHVLNIYDDIQKAMQDR